MKSNITIGLFALCCFLVVGLIWQRQRIRELKDRPPVVQVDTVYSHSVTYDTVHPTPITLVKCDTVEITEVDTVYFNNPISQKVAADFFSYKYYDDVLKDDSTGYVRIKSTVHKNTLEDRKLFFESRCRNQIITETVYETSRNLYAMPSLLVSKEGLGISGNLIYQDKKNRLYGLNITLTENIYYGLGIGFAF